MIIETELVEKLLTAIVKQKYISESNSSFKDLTQKEIDDVYEEAEIFLYTNK